MKYIVNLNNRVYEVEVEKGEAQIIAEYEPTQDNNIVEKKEANAASETTSFSDGNIVKAPIPGNILTVKVSVGQSVKAGDVLLLIEAMKMENEVCAPTDGVVKNICVANGQIVATGDNLIII